MFSAVHFLSVQGGMCHHDLKHFNIAVLEREDGMPHASIIDFGTCYPCEWIPEDVLGTVSYHPWEVHVESNYHRLERDVIDSLQRRFEPLENMYDEHSHLLLTRRRPGRFDAPAGACDTFGVGCMLAELMYGIQELVPQHKASL
eukprot:TRINITY_DN14625_c0_g2_i1.p1 TRINITY_DN14625_c0_g2~~TRINITY_DN14625_c0_g2_i1.p1  ORF type:complete len:144 (+),score=23.73 TRINITY_DN14625_c0_g2_i1:191-622(+)